MTVDKAKLEIRLNELEEILQEPMENNPQSLQQRIILLSAQLGWIPKLKADINEKLNIETGKAMKIYTFEGDRKILWSALSQMVKGDVAEWEAFSTRIEKISSAIVHQLDAARSLLSYIKEEMRNLNP